ncbi:MAG: Hsp20/alpha crystallin family protein [Christensenellales bacterium]
MAGLVPFNTNQNTSLSTGFDDFYNMLDDFFADNWPFRRSLTADTFKVDVQENENEYIVEAELPGVKKEEVSVAMEDGKLRILVSREEKSEEKGKNYLHKERRFSSMARHIYLVDANSAGIKGKLEEGVLRIAVPKTEKQDRSVKVDIE